MRKLIGTTLVFLVSFSARALTLNPASETVVVECHSGGMSFDRHMVSRGVSTEGTPYVRVWIDNMSCADFDLMTVEQPRYSGSADALTVHGTGGFVNFFSHNGEISVIGMKATKFGRLEMHDLRALTCTGDLSKFLN